MTEVYNMVQQKCVIQHWPPKKFGSIFSIDYHFATLRTFRLVLTSGLFNGRVELEELKDGSVDGSTATRRIHVANVESGPWGPSQDFWIQGSARKDTFGMMYPCSCVQVCPTFGGSLMGAGDDGNMCNIWNGWGA